MITGKPWKNKDLIARVEEEAGQGLVMRIEALFTLLKQEDNFDYRSQICHALNYFQNCKKDDCLSYFRHRYSQILKDRGYV